MLNDRQFNIIRDLETAKDLITANTLAEKYKVSLRTIRNDIEEISYAVSKYDIEFLRVPKMGMRIISNGNLHTRLLNDYHSTSFLSLSQNQQNYLIALMFLMLDNPVTLDTIGEVTQISKVTQSNKVQQCANYLSAFSLKIQSVKNKGNYLIGECKSINDLLIDICDNINSNLYTSFIQDSFLSKKEIDIVDDIIRFIAKELLFTPTNYDSLKIIFSYLIKQTNLYPKDANDYTHKDTETILIGPNASRLVLHIDKLLNISLNEGYIALIKTALLKYTDSTSLLRKSYDTSENLEKAVHIMVQQGISIYPSLLEDANDLEKNLMMHLYYTINRIKANLNNDNPLLKQIKNRFPVVFNNIMEISKTFMDNYPLVIDENECSYITLYFLNYLEKAKTRKRVNALLVCTSGVGATKLLSTKIKNNFPTIEIIGTSSFFDLQINNADLSNIDIILSTIKLPENITIPSVVVSPLLDYEDSAKISALLPSHSISKSHQDNSYLYDLSKDESHNIGLLFSEVTVYIFDMLEEIYKLDYPTLSSSNCVGLCSHIFMSIDRWAKHDYIKSTDFDNFRSRYPKEMKVILHFLSKVEKLFEIFIDPIEATAIMRYIIEQ